MHPLQCTSHHLYTDQFNWLFKLINFNYCYFNLGVKYFGVIKYFFRLDYTTAVQSVPICAVQWIQFNAVKDTINCVIGQIPMNSWHEFDGPSNTKKQTVHFVE